MTCPKESSGITSLALILLLIASSSLSTLAIVPVATAATPTLDCGGSCPATSGSASGGSTHPISMSVALTTSSSPDLIVVIVSGGATHDAPNPPSLSGVTFSSVCSYAATAPIIFIYAGKATSTLSKATISETEDGATGSSTGGMVAFGIAGYDTTDASPVDGSCSPGSSSGTALSTSISGLTYGNDFIFAGATTSGGTLSASGSTTLAAANSGATYSAAGYQLGGGGGSYTLTFTSATSGTWSELVVAIKASSPSAVPLFPEGVLPLLVVIPVLYFVVVSRKSRTKSEEIR